MNDYKFDRDIVIGLEIHAELATKSKLFCGCARTGNEEPNTRTCPVCLGHPGSKPVLNKKALDYALKLCLAMNCGIAPELVFSRKSYFYPDMSKNYQISQYEMPLGENGSLCLPDGKKIGITRIHMEEDPASLVHPNGISNSSFVLVDYNRSGNPLAEIVTEPDLASASEARDFMKELIKVLEYLEVFDIDNCIIKADANVSIKESGYSRVEVKNITGFKEIERALNYEIQRQKQVALSGESIVLETRSWDAQKGITHSLRLKESEEDYGYITDPDLVPVDITKEMIKETQDNMPELHHVKYAKFIETHKLSEDDAKVISSSPKLAKLFEEVSKKVDPVFTAKWIRRELVRVMNYNKMDFENLKVEPEHLIELFSFIHDGKITEKTGQKIIEQLIVEPFNVSDYVHKNGLEVIQDDSAIENMCKEAMSENPQAVEELKAGNNKSLNFLVGKVMQKSKGKASPQTVVEIIRKLI